jgi:hypothetical protein
MLRRASFVLVPLALITFAAVGQPALAAKPSGGGGGGGKAGAPKAPGFTAPIVLPGSGDDGGNEPTIAISNSGVRYVAWQSPGEFARSSDGVNWTNTGFADTGAAGDVHNQVDAAGALYNVQICGGVTELHNCLYRSLDGGTTWETRSIIADMHPGAADRPWIDVYPKKTSGAWNSDQTTVYLEYHTFSPEELAYVTVSHDGGATFSEPKFITSSTNAIVSSGCNTVPGGVAVNQSSPNGQLVYALWLSGNDVESNAQTGCNYSQIGPFNKAWLSTSTDGGTTWTAHQAWLGNFDLTTKIGDNADKIFASFALDQAGQVQVVLPVRHEDDPVTFAATGTETPQSTDLYILTSPDQGAHWTQPFKINQTTGSYFFPWITAGSSGRLDIVYYRSSTLMPNDDTSQWFIGFTQVLGAVAARTGSTASYSGTLTVSEQLLDPEAVHIGGICSFGLFCAALPSSNRNLADSIAVVLDPAGGANAVYTVDAPGQLASGEGDSHVEYVCQSSGPSAFTSVKSISGCYKGTA